ncbi:hypothetical protein NHX12_013007 [Muraenolepis orangiensis]|uniref:Uncharacterized protein n=1 Tax=Muraenolepis orangiensis TaxID=630683 RepID=A0A9Q0DDZ0_9TELE|nr:hypothetical protein NHX12_013007 [Muraenolepis orangiensis]
MDSSTHAGRFQYIVSKTASFDTLHMAKEDPRPSVSANPLKVSVLGEGEGEGEAGGRWADLTGGVRLQKAPPCRYKHQRELFGHSVIYHARRWRGDKYPPKNARGVTGEKPEERLRGDPLSRSRAGPDGPETSTRRAG